tara:strand:- start:6555 stop:6974 length:420 start_codon:yes stop_codon:yes gene_type:complete
MKTYSLQERIQKLQTILESYFPGNKIHKPVNKLVKSLDKGDMDSALNLLGKINTSLKTMCNTNLGMNCQDSNLAHNTHLDDLDEVIFYDEQLSSAPQEFSDLVNMAFLAIFLNESGYKSRINQLQLAFEHYSLQQEETT